MRKNKTWLINLFGQSTIIGQGKFERVQNDEFWTNDTDAYLNFKPTHEAFDFSNAELTLYNKTDGSLIVKTADVERGVATYEMDPEVIAHFGQWTLQVRFIKGNESSTSSIIEFEVKRALGDGIPERLTAIQSWDTFFTHAQETIDLMEEAELTRIQAELDRQAQEEARERKYEDLINKAIIEADIDGKVDIKIVELTPAITNLDKRVTSLERDAIIMGVEWDRGPSPTMKRIGASEGLVANIGVADEVVRNDFDTMPIYREMQRETDKFGNVFVRIPKFYIRKTVTDNLYRVEISTEKLKGFYLPAIFYDFEKDKELEYSLIGAYLASNSADGTKLESKAGVKPLASRNIVQFRDYATANGMGYQQLDIHAVDVIQTLFRVEFATLNSQTVHPGFTAGNTESAFTGGTDELIATSGAMGASGSHQFVYRGIEDPWGNVYQFVDGVNINNHQAWVCRDARQYASNVFASPYERLGYVNATENIWVTEMGHDSNNPFAELPISGGGGATTYYADHYYQSVGQRIARLGGSWSSGTPAGTSFWALDGSSAAAGTNISSRLLKLPL